MTNKSLQEEYAPESICFGCGPANKKGLGIRSFVNGEEVVAEWTPKQHHQAFSGTLNGGIVGVLLDCHSNWTAAWHLMKHTAADRPPCTVTANYCVRLLRPTPSTSPIELTSGPIELHNNRAVIKAKLIADGKVCATSRGTFVAVKDGHPAFNRW
jgi:acyl-coenzyme A thioesterase PaaI-like protein